MVLYNIITMEVEDGMMFYIKMKIDFTFIDIPL